MGGAAHGDDHGQGGAHGDGGHGHDAHGPDAHGHGHDAHAHGHDAHAHGHDAHAHGGAHAGMAIIPDIEPPVHHHHHGPELKDTAPLGPARKMVDLGDGVTVACIDQGEGPAVLLLHGFPTSSAIWRRVVERLKGRYRCIAPDLLGFGDTVCPVDADYSLSAQAEVVMRLVEALGLDAFALVGHDIGGGVAQVLAARYPERIRQLTLVDAVCFGHVPPPVVKMIAGLARVSAVFDLVCETGALRAFAKSRFGMRAGAAEATSISDAFIESCIAPLYRETPPSYSAPRQRFRGALLQFVREGPAEWRAASDALRDIVTPSLVVWGCDDPYLSVSLAKQMQEALPGCVGLELIPYCGHWVPEEAPVRLSEILEPHLAAALGGAAASEAEAVAASA